MAGRNGQFAIGKETTYGTFATGTKLLRGLSESLVKNKNNIVDESLVGTLLPTTQIKVGSNVTGGTEFNVHPDEAGWWFFLALGAEPAVGHPAGAYVIVDYTGSENYASLTKSGTSLTAEVGADSATAAADTNFNTTGTIDLSGAAFDTAAELATAINSYTGWQATYFGTVSSDTSTIGDFTETALKEYGVRQQSIDMACQITSTAAKLHKFYPAASTDDLPSVSLTIDRTLGTGESVAIVGMKLNSIALSLSAAGLLTASIDWKAKDREKDKTFPSLGCYSGVQAYKATKAEIMINEFQFSELKSFNMTINNNLDDNTVLGSEYNNEPLRQSGSVEFDGEYNLIAGAGNNYAVLDDLWDNDNNVQVKLYIEGVDEADTDVKFNMLINLKVCKLSTNTLTLSTADRLPVSFSGATYQDPCDTKPYEVWVTDQVTTTY